MPIKPGDKVQSINFPEVTGVVTVLGIVTMTIFGKSVIHAEFEEGGHWCLDGLEIVQEAPSDY